MSSEEAVHQPAILLEHLSKKYPIYRRPSHKFLELLSFRRLQWHEEFWALRDISIRVDAGTTLGVIGQNGSGKSTLLQILAGILRQTRGDCFVRGRVSALLELGAGFNPEFTGRENVYMNGAVMGMTRRQLERRMDQILDFAEIGQFIDQPVKTYSSGMFMRLAFSVAIHVEPEILLVDEALAVGDLVFQHRCTSRMRQLRDQGRTIVFVTHDLQAVTRFCDRAILLDRGRKLEDGSPKEVVEAYHALIYRREREKAGQADRLPEAEEDGKLPVVRTIPHIHNRYGDGGARVIGIILLAEDGAVLNEVRAGEAVRLLISVRFIEATRNPIVGFTVRDRLGVEITSSNTSYEGLQLPDARPGEVFTVSFQIKLPTLRPGSYSMSPAVARGNIWEHRIEDWIDNAYIFNLADTGLIYGQMRWPVKAAFRRTRDDGPPDKGDPETAAPAGETPHG